MKHLNPRQGITTDELVRRHGYRGVIAKCETPKSPPGDYNLISAERSFDQIFCAIV